MCCIRGRVPAGFRRELAEELDQEAVEHLAGLLDHRLPTLLSHCVFHCLRLDLDPGVPARHLGGRVLATSAGVLRRAVRVVLLSVRVIEPNRVLLLHP